MNIVGRYFVGRRQRKASIRRMMEGHFGGGVRLAELSVVERSFPFRVRADLQRAVDQLLTADAGVVRFCGVRKEFAHEGIDFSGLVADTYSPAVAAAPQYEEIDVGDDQPVRCLKNGLWLLRDQGGPFAVLLAAAMEYGQPKGLTFQVATVPGEAGVATSQRFFDHLERAVQAAQSYRGKILSLEQETSYSGQAVGIKVHKLHAVRAEQVILPKRTLELLHRNVIDFVQHRPKLARHGQATKKGILLYGPPGTGKTHTLHYLASALPAHTTLLISGEQVGLLGDYMTLARLLQPSLVVIEDVDLIARNREAMHSPCEEALLNKLLNEMDGLREDGQILFVLTTNRPHMLEAALASRPGRIDQAIEFPLPDQQGREQLVRLYARNTALSDELVSLIAQRTQGVSGAFIKELMRRSVQCLAERGDDDRIELRDVELALDEMLFAGGTLNRNLLGGAEHDSAVSADVRDDSRPAADGS